MSFTRNLNLSSKLDRGSDFFEIIPNYYTYRSEPFDVKLFKIITMKICLSMLLVLSALGSAILVRVPVSTRLGTIIGTSVETLFNNRTGNVTRFLGIPYAEAPIGDRRFQKPVPKLNLSDPFEALEFGPACPQNLFMMTVWMPGFPEVDEDCLTVNVFVPDTGNDTGPHESQAVMVWIHGGAYVIGQSKIYSAENLTLFGDIIVVTFNYRLSSLGFLSTGSSKFPGNAGLWDQRLALQWVNDNIADFGGDPNRITLFGESAGASSALYQTVFGGSKKLFHRLILQSGSNLSPWAYQPEPLIYARRVAERLGCFDINLDNAVMCLQNKDAMLVINASSVGTQDETALRAEWAPSHDGVFVTSIPPKSDQLVTFKDIDVIIGVNSYDGAFQTLLSIEPYMTQKLNKSFESGIPADFFRNFYIPFFLSEKYSRVDNVLIDLVDYVYTDFRDPYNQNYTRDRFLEFSGDLILYMPVFEILQSHASFTHGPKTFLYEFGTRPSFSTMPEYVTGANHGDELPFVFGFPELMDRGIGFYDRIDGAELQLSEDIMILWSNFAKTG